MKVTMRCWSAAALMLLLGCWTSQAQVRRNLDYAPAPVDNPLKGLVPYQGDVRDRFPHSLEFNYLPYSSLVKGMDDFDWQALETMLDDIASRGHQAIFRIFLEYPGKTGVIPQFLLEGGLKVTTWNYAEDASGRASQVETPDYENELLRRSLKRFITALGRKYDGDPRLGFITAGLLGIWGEWHNHPRVDLSASKRTQREVLTAYESAFRITPVLLRYPAGEDDPHYAANAGRPFGYHDDSFAWATLHTGRKSDTWFFMTALRAAGPDAELKWKTQPIGGEIRPEAWGQVFDAVPTRQEIQDFRACVEATRVTWLMDSGLFRRVQPAERLERAREQVRRMGYEFHARAVELGAVVNSRLTVSLEIENRGVAPFYFGWKSQWALLENGSPVRTFDGAGELRGLLPGGEPRLWRETLDVGQLPTGNYTVAVRVPNVLSNGKPVGFANRTHDPATGWLSVGEVSLP